MNKKIHILTIKEKALFCLTNIGFMASTVPLIYFMYNPSLWFLLGVASLLLMISIKGIIYISGQIDNSDTNYFGTILFYRCCSNLKTFLFTILAILTLATFVCHLSLDILKSVAMMYFLASIAMEITVKEPNRAAEKEGYQIFWKDNNKNK